MNRGALNSIRIDFRKSLLKITKDSLENLVELANSDLKFESSKFKGDAKSTT